MVGRTTSLGTIQKIPEINSRGTNVDTAIAMYTVPTGKKAIVSGAFILRSYGAAVEVRVRLDGTNILTWESATEPAPPFRAKSFADQELDAGDTVTKSQDAGVNATLDFNLIIKELPV